MLNCLRRTVALGVLGLAMIGAAACGLDNNKMPALSGPSTLGLSIAMTASPDQLPRDGSSQSVITLTARDAQGRVVAGQRLSLSLDLDAPQGAAVSQTEVTTGSGGQATFAVTAPTAGSLGDITILATPIGVDAGNASARAISIAAIPRNNSVPRFPTPPFEVSCANALINADCTTDPEVGQVVTFDASGVIDEGIKCNACTFRWNFGGEATATGQIVSYAFTAGGSYVVTLTVTDAGGLTATAQRNIFVLVAGPATVNFVPPAPVAGQTATFISTSAAAPNHRIVSYTWSWGDGSANQTTAATSIQHTYDQAGTYPVTLTVRDDLGQSANVTKAVVVGSGLLPAFTQSPATVSVGQTVFFDASGSSSATGTKITNYLFDFGDGTSQSSSFPSAKHEYTLPGAYVVRLTITDEKGRTASTTIVGAGVGFGNITVTP